MSGICPTGWHLPSDGEWTQMENFLGGSSVAGDKLRDTTFWGNNSSGFTALPGGLRFNDGSFSGLGNYGYWWTATELDSSIARNRRLVYYSEQVYPHYYDKYYGFSVRCVRDN